MRKYEQVLKIVPAVIYRSTRDVPVYCDGSNDLFRIADRINRPVWELFTLVDSLAENGLIKKVNHG